MAQTTPTRASLDTVEALLAQQRLAQEQLGRDLQAARTEQATGPLSAPSFVPWGPSVWFALSALMLLAIVVLLFVKVIQPRLRGLQRLRLQEQTRAEEMFVEHASLGDGYSRGVLNEALAAQREATLAPSKAAVADDGLSNLASADPADSATWSPMAAQDAHVDLDLDLDLSLDWDAPEVASDVTFEPTRAITDEPEHKEPRSHLPTNSQWSPLGDQTSADDTSKFVSAEVKKVQQSLAEKRIARQSNFMPLPTQTAAAFIPEATQPLLLLPSLPHEDPTPAEPASSELKPAPLASQNAPLEAHWQIQFDLAREYAGMGLVQEAAMLYADLVAQGQPDVAQRADALLSALPQSR